MLSAPQNWGNERLNEFKLSEKFVREAKAEEKSTAVEDQSSKDTQDLMFQFHPYT